MKRFLSIIFLFIASPAFAGGVPYDSGGCTVEQTNMFCSGIGFLLLALLVLAVVGGIWDAYKLKTDPAYRAHAEKIHREFDEKHRRY